MKCPVCATVDLVMSNRQGVEIDYCPQCRGVWLDRGELDKIIERSIATPEHHVVSAPPAYGYPIQDRQQGHHGDHHRSGHHHDGYHRRKSFWHDLFD